HYGPSRERRSMSHNLRHLVLVTCLALALDGLACVSLPTVSGQEAAEQRHKAQADRDGPALPPGAIRRLGTVHEPAKNNLGLISVTFFPDGQTVASTDWAGNLVFWDVRTDKQLRSLQDHFTVVFSLDCTKFASRAKVSDKDVRILDVKTGKEISRISP